jgi:hypothetical protein
VRLHTALALVLVAAPANADDSPTPRWTRGPAGGAFGFIVDGGATAGLFGLESFAAASLGVGGTFRWFEASATGYFGSSFDSIFRGGAFLVRLAARIPINFVAFTFGASLGYVDVPGHLVTGVAVEPISLGFEFDPICHLRIGVLGAYGQVVGEAPQTTLRGALTIGYATGRCR